MKREGKPIPGDWDGESYSFYMLCGPDSILWHGYIKGAIYELTRGRGWDINTGNIKAVQAIAQEIYNSMAKCDDLIKVQRMLVAAIVGEAVDLTDPAQLVPDAVDYTGIGLAAQLRTVDADKRLADVVEDVQLSPVTNVTNQVDPAVVTVNNNMDTQAIADNVEAFRVTYETQSTAETVAANTRNADLITALETLKLACNTVVKCGGYGSCGGSDPPSQPGTEGGDPPFGFSEPTYEGQPTDPGTPQYNVRKCKIANLFHDRIIESFQKLNDIPYIGSGLDVMLDLFGAAWLFAISALINAYMSTIAILGVSISISGWVDELAQSLIEGGTDLDALILNLQTNRESYICALYSSSSSDVAISDYLGAAEDAGMNVVNIAVLSAFLISDYISILFFNRDDIQAELEEALDGYTGPVDCSGCGCISYGFAENGGVELGVGDVDNGGVFSSVHDPLRGYEVIYVRFGFIRNVTLSALSGWTTQGGDNNDFRIGSGYCVDPPAGAVDDIYSSDNAPTFPYTTNMGGFSFESQTPFSINVQFN